jgi:hypothetical protein
MVYLLKMVIFSIAFCKRLPEGSLPDASGKLRGELENLMFF